MSRTAARCTQADVARALRAVEQIGARMAVEILPSGVIRIVPYDGAQGVDRAPAHEADAPEFDDAPVGPL